MDLVLRYHALSSSKRSESETIRDFERETGVKRQLVHGWRQLLIDRAEEVFAHRTKTRTLAERCDRLERENQNLSRQIAEFEQLEDDDDA